MNAADEALIQAIQRGSLGQRDPDAEPRRHGDGDTDSDNGSDNDHSQADGLAERGARAGNGNGNGEQGEAVSADMARLLADTALRQQLGIGGSFTGPKGVVNDRRFHERQERARAAARHDADVRKWSSQALSSGWLQRQLAAERGIGNNNSSNSNSKSNEHAQADELDLLDELDELEDDDDYIREYRNRRMLEMAAMSVRARFGSVLELASGSEFVAAIDDEDPAVVVVVHLYKSELQACRIVNTFLDRLASTYPTIKFARIVSSKADATFDDVALPAILVYEAGSLMKTLLRITDEIPDWSRYGRVEFEDFEAYLWDTGAIRETDSSLARSLGKLALGTTLDPQELLSRVSESQSTAKHTSGFIGGTNTTRRRQNISHDDGSDGDDD